VNSSVSPLLVQGLIISAIGLGLVFAALALLWGLTWLLTKVLADKEAPAPQVSLALDEADLAEAQAAVEAAAELTEERDQGSEPQTSHRSHSVRSR
jgi:Na+-transporting methylmalonyl-CoA/oxaloacetate decarboxylase gamma subunit